MSRERNISTLKVQRIQISKMNSSKTTCPLINFDNWFDKLPNITVTLLIYQRNWFSWRWTKMREWNLSINIICYFHTESIILFHVDISHFGIELYIEHIRFIPNISLDQFKFKGNKCIERSSLPWLICVMSCKNTFNFYLHWNWCFWSKEKS